MKNKSDVSKIVEAIIRDSGSFELNPQNVTTIEIMPQAPESLRPHIHPVTMYRGEAYGFQVYACEPLKYGFWRIVAPFRDGVMVTPYLSPLEAWEAGMLQKAGL